jgi:hypothetical protein
MLMHASWIATNVLVFSLSILPVCATHPMKKPAKNTRKLQKQKKIKSYKSKKKNKILEKKKQQQKK